MKSKLIKWVLSSLFLVILISCTLEEPVLPTWFAEWGIPFDAGFTMTEVLDDPNFITDTTGTGEVRIAISISDTSDEKTVTSSDLAIKPEDDSAGDTIDDLTLGTQGPEKSSTFDLTDMIPGPVVPGTVIIPPGMTVEIDLIYLLYYDIKYAHIETGTFQIELVNNTPLDIDAGTQITIYDDSTNTEIGTAIIPGTVPANSSAFATPDMPLDDKVIHTRFRLVMQIPIVPGSKDITQEGIDNSTSWVNGTLFDLTVLEAEARFPEQTLLITDSTSVIEEEHRIRKGIIDEGQIFLTLENNIEATARVKVRLLNLHHVLTGETLTDSIVLAPNSTTPKTIFVENYRIADYPDSNSGELVDYIHYEVDIVTDSTESYVTISQDDDVFVRVQPDSLYFRMIDGIVNRIEIDIDPIVKDDFDDFSKIDGTIYLDSLEMKLNMRNETNLPIDITLYISGTDDIREVTLDPIHATIPRAEEGGYLQLKLRGDENSDNDIVDLMSILPTSIRMEAQAFIDGSGSVRVGQNVWADYQIYSPLFIRIVEPSSINTDIIEEAIDEDVRDKIENNVKSAVFLFNIENGLPVGSEAVVYVSNDSTKLFDDTIPDDDSTKFTIRELIAAGNIGTDGFVDIPENSDFQINLTKDRRKLFYRNEIIYIGTKVILDDTDNKLVKFRPEDEISILGFFKFNFLMNE
ncbi:MAG: hypothetical protein KAV45_04500 [Calditrichia bacterium]|nr:hypothetical protein [Calditrichia bacterium]